MRCSANRVDATRRERGDVGGDWAELYCEPFDDFEAVAGQLTCQRTVVLASRIALPRHSSFLPKRLNPIQTLCLRWGQRCDQSWRGQRYRRMRSPGPTR